MNLTVREKSIKFIGHFLTWYQNSFGQSDVFNHIKLLDLVKEAEDIHMQKIKEMELQLFTKAFKIKKEKKKHKKISKYF